jgi:hypothetical protein
MKIEPDFCLSFYLQSENTLGSAFVRPSVISVPAIDIYGACAVDSCGPIH